MIRISIKTNLRKEAIDITGIVKKHVKNIKNGIAVVYVPHTTAGIAINEAYDPSVAEDIIETLSKLIPYSGNYKHLEGNADAHIQATITGNSIQIIIQNGQLQLGRWQGIFFLEFDGPRHREIYIKTIEG
ncbi:secondary thiamine-phosphate synthase enzyme YjbQ [Hippea jasoniae]|uniref:secondary thiamine-phosphate synthase enzyme YjbQ n=1 Tax=Hippea jasoniae TaxID=944479 RepID=UPI0005560C82|nr:secondary thiamine-phosphate synthase enzyme YjbQ [Hippea jasoniae]